MPDPVTAPELHTIDGADIVDAARRIAGVVVQTPLQRSARLSELTGADVYLKREDLQVVRSYKLRGAYNRMSRLAPADRSLGVVCASAGNHAQGFAFACRTLGVLRAASICPAQRPARSATGSGSTAASGSS